MFFKEINETDLGKTSIDNIFIDIFMPMASGLYVSVYLLGYRYACDASSSPKFNNNTIAKNLNVPLSDVLDAWDFWINKGIIKKHKNDTINDFDFSIEFLDLKKIYMEKILNSSYSSKSDVNNVVSASENITIRTMFNSINKIIGRYLQPNEKINILDIMDKYNMSSDMVICAYEYVQDKNGASKPVNYIEGILRNWYDSNIYTPQEAQESFNMRNERYMMYRTIFNELGFFSRQPSKSEREAMDSWFDKMHLDIELILEACSKSKNISNPSITYINGILKSWNEKNIKDLNDLKNDENKQKSTPTVKFKQSNSNKPNTTYTKTKFHNFEETFTKYTPEELDKIIEQSQKEKFK